MMSFDGDKKIFVVSILFLGDVKNYEKARATLCSFIAKDLDPSSGER